LRGARVYPWIALAALLAGCGSDGNAPRLAPPADPRTIELGWVERSTSPGLVYRVDRLVVEPDGWRVDLAVENRTADDFQIRRPHRFRGSVFGLVLLETTRREELRELTADHREEPPFLEPDRISPPLPVSLRAGAAWRGSLYGTSALRRGTVVRVIFGRFVRDRKPMVITWVTDHAVRL
jgi:hypothetical protein